MAYCDRKDSESVGAWFEEAYALIYFVVICCVVRIIYAVIRNPNGNVDFSEILRFLIGAGDPLLWSSVLAWEILE